MYERGSIEKHKDKEKARIVGKIESVSQYGHPSVSDNFEMNKLSIKSDIQRNLIKDKGNDNNRLPFADSKEEVKLSNDNNRTCISIENSRPNKVYQHTPIIDDEIDDFSSEDFN